MTRKDFRAFAEMIASESRQADPATTVMLERIAEKMAAIFRAENPRFDAVRFQRACFPVDPSLKG
jgi:acetate kinase